MVETTKFEMSLSELIVVITALHSFEQSLLNKELRTDTILNIYNAEKFFNFDFEIKALISNPYKFISKSIGLPCSNLYDAYYDLAELNNALKPLPPEDERCTALELLDFCGSDIKSPSEGRLK